VSLPTPYTHLSSFTNTTPGAALDANAPLPEDLEPSGAVDSDEEKDAVMAALARHRPRPLATYTHVSQRSKYQFVRMKGMIRSALGAPPGGSSGGGGFFSGFPMGGNDGMNTSRGLAMGMFGSMTPSGEQFPQSAGFPLSASLDGGAGSRRQSVMGMGSANGGGGGGPRQILPGQLPGPGAQARKSSMASVGVS
jgi:SAGA-associated factor 73